MTGNVAHFIEQLRGEGYYPAIDPPTFEVTPEGTALAHDEDVRIFYTVDGSDPRAPGGGIEGGAIEARPGERVSEGALRARARRGGEWSAISRRDPP